MKVRIYLLVSVAALLHIESASAQPVETTRPGPEATPPMPPPAPPFAGTPGLITAMDVDAFARVAPTPKSSYLEAIEEACKPCATGGCSSELQQICGSAAITAALAAAATERTARGSQLCDDPTASCYASYWRRAGVDVDELDRLTLHEDSAQKLHLLQGSAGERVGGELAAAVVGGLQGFLQERAKEEALTFAIDRLKSRLCSAENEAWFAKTCALLAASDLELDEATLLRLRRALERDLGVLALKFIPAPKTADERAFQIVIEGAARVVIEVVLEGMSLGKVPKAWTAANKGLYAAATGQQSECEIKKRPDNTVAIMGAGCWALLVPELGAAAVEINLDLAHPTSAMLAAIVERAAVSFCASYGAQANDPNGRCMLGQPEAYEAARTKLEKLARASLHFAASVKRALQLARSSPSEKVLAQVISDLRTAFEAWDVALREVDASTKLAQHLGYAKVVLEASAAVANRDYVLVVALLSDSFATGGAFAGMSLPKELTHSVSFAARLASAKDAADAKKAFEEEAAPLGTYKIKYDRDGFTFALNAFVGAFVGTGDEWNVRAGHKDPGLRTRPLTAPVGFDLTFPSNNHHAGLMLSVIDPFAVGTLNDEAEAAEIEWGAILMPGLFFRWGMFDSPFALMAGATYQPLARSSETCGSGPCWKGAWQAGVSLAVDIPLLVLH